MMAKTMAIKGHLRIPVLFRVFLLISTATLLCSLCEAAAAASGFAVSSRHLLRNDDVLGPWRSVERESSPSGFSASDSTLDQKDHYNQRRVAEELILSGKGVLDDKPKPPPFETPAQPSGILPSPPPPPPNSSPPPPPPDLSPPPPFVYKSPPPPPSVFNSPPPPPFNSPPPPPFPPSSPPPPSPPPPSHPPPKSHPPPDCDDDDDDDDDRWHHQPHHPHPHCKHPPTAHHPPPPHHPPPSNGTSLPPP